MLALPDHFKLFDLQRRFEIDAEALDAAYRTVQSHVHPDRFAAGTAAESRVAMQWATRANEAYRTLKSPLKRAAYLCELAGVSIDAESNTVMPADFLNQQMEWREALDEAAQAGERPVLLKLDQQMGAERARITGEIARALDGEADYRLAASKVRQLMFVEKFGIEVSSAVEALRGNHASA